MLIFLIIKDWEEREFSNDKEKIYAFFYPFFFLSFGVLWYYIKFISRRKDYKRSN
jgi:hypothetical protein